MGTGSEQVKVFSTMKIVREVPVPLCAEGDSPDFCGILPQKSGLSP